MLYFNVNYAFVFLLFSLQEFRYLESNGHLSTSVHIGDPQEILEPEVEKAIVRFQQFYKIPTSGIMDNTTRGTMWQPRCGFPDIVRFNDGGEDAVSGTTNHRRKRYNAPGGFYKWKSPKLTYS